MFFVGLLGAAVGSFLNVLIDRIPRGEDIISKPSHCDFCKKRLRWFELVPLVSFVFQRGRCRRCSKKLSMQYPLVESATAIGFVLFTPHVLTLAVFCALLVIFVVDLKHQIIPDSMTGIVFFAAIARGPGIGEVISGAVAGMSFYALWRVTRGRGLGFGDVKLAAALGLVLGYPHILIGLYTAFLTGALWGVILMITRRAGMKTKIAFGPFLVLGWTVSELWGDELLRTAWILL